MLKYGEICRNSGIKGALVFIFLHKKRALRHVFEGVQGGFIKKIRSIKGGGY